MIQRSFFVLVEASTDLKHIFPDLLAVAIRQMQRLGSDHVDTSWAVIAPVLTRVSLRSVLCCNAVSSFYRWSCCVCILRTARVDGAGSGSREAAHARTSFLLVRRSCLMYTDLSIRSQASRLPKCYLADGIRVRASVSDLPCHEGGGSDAGKAQARPRS
jgi:hypothetical protein